MKRSINHLMWIAILISSITAISCRELVSSDLEFPDDSISLVLSINGPDGTRLSGAKIDVRNQVYVSGEGRSVSRVFLDENGAAVSDERVIPGYYDVEIEPIQQTDLTEATLIELHTRDLPWNLTYEAFEISERLTPPPGFPLIDWTAENVDFYGWRRRPRQEDIFYDPWEDWSPRLASDGQVLQWIPEGSWRLRVRLDELPPFEYFSIEWSASDSLAQGLPDWDLVPVTLELPDIPSSDPGDSVLVRIDTPYGCDSEVLPTDVDDINITYVVSLLEFPIRIWVPNFGARVSLFESSRSHVRFLGTGALRVCVEAPLEGSTVQPAVPSVLVRFHFAGITDFSAFSFFARDVNDRRESLMPIPPSGQVVLMMEPNTLWIEVETLSGDLVHEEILVVTQDTVMTIDLSGAETP